MIIDCVADLHGFVPNLHKNKGDLLIVAGDLTSRDLSEEHIEILSYLSKLNYKKIIIVAGNHDNFLQTHQGDSLIRTFSENIQYHCDSGTEFDGLKIWGSPWTKTFPGMNPHCKAFTCDTEEELAEKWALIPRGIDILVTHSPPYGILDQIERYKEGKIENVGSSSLSDKFRGSCTLKLHVFGHIHEHGGRVIRHLTKYVNASHVNERYQPVNKPIRIEL